MRTIQSVPPKLRPQVLLQGWGFVTLLVRTFPRPTQIVPAAVPHPHMLAGQFVPSVAACLPRWRFVPSRCAASRPKLLTLLVWMINGEQ